METINVIYTVSAQCRQGLSPRLQELFPHNHRAGTLMGGEHKHLGNLHMGRRFVYRW